MQVSSQSSVSFTVDCLPGFDGGAPQVFIQMMILYHHAIMMMDFDNNDANDNFDVDVEQKCWTKNLAGI